MFLSELKAEASDGVQCRFLADEDERVLVVDIDGVCRRGMACDDGAAFMYARTVEHLVSIHPMSLVLDLRDLRCGGCAPVERLLRVTDDFNAFGGTPSVPVVVVVSRESRAAVASQGGWDADFPPAWVFEDWVSALDYAARAGRDWLAADEPCFH